jgi:hypothetical protein
MNELDAVADDVRLGPADFKTLEKLRAAIMTPPADLIDPKSGRIVSPPNAELSRAFFNFLTIAEQIKGTSKMFPTMGQVRVEQRKQKAERDAKCNAQNYNGKVLTYND